jgi:hypothetical protein
MARFAEPAARAFARFARPELEVRGAVTDLYRETRSAVIVSSATSRRPLRARASASAATNAGSGATQPVLHITGSKMMAAAS